MSLSPGARLGPYEITAKLGEGGMGEVYRATDTHLGRQVAIKVLPDGFAQDAERVARCERDAKTLALNQRSPAGYDDTSSLVIGSWNLQPTVGDSC